jgi:osmoprotectant transport system permease protein
MIGMSKARFVSPLMATFMATWLVLQVLEPAVAKAEEAIAIGSKAFTEGYVLAEIAAQVVERKSSHGVQRRFGMGGTGILFEALKKGEIQVYPEYTGTIAEAILKDPTIKTHSGIQEKLDDLGLVMSGPLGFNNTYALAVTRELASAHELRRISDLAKIAPRIRSAFSHEFMNRSDGFHALKSRYRLDFGRDRRSLEHSLAYEAIARRQVDLIDVYSTDAKIEKLDLVVLEDDLAFFPEYQAVFLARADFVQNNPGAWAALKTLENSLSEPTMVALNADADLRKLGFGTIADGYLRGLVGESGQMSAAGAFDDGLVARVWRRTKEHLVLVGITLLFSIAFGVPLGVLAARNAVFGQGVILASAMIQTIPSLALLCFLIPFFGIGLKPALVALCLYGLLPIIMNTLVGIRGIDSRLKETAHALGLDGWRRILLIELPLASPNILAGIKTSAIIGIGTATLAALIGAGGYGVPIVTGLAMNDIDTILIGAVPAAGMSLFAHLGFELLGKIVVPRGLQ